MKELTHEQIKKALQLCGYFGSGNCEKCPLFDCYVDLEDCGTILPKLALQMIMELEGYKSTN